MRYNHILVDGQNLFWRMYTVAIKKYIDETSNAISSWAIKSSLNYVQKIRKEFGYSDSTIYMLFDNPQTVINIRKEIYEDYKSSSSY